MGIKQQISSIESLLEIIQKEDLTKLYATKAPAQPWNNLTETEIQEIVEGTIGLLQEASDNSVLSSIPFNTLNSINSSLNNFQTQFQSIKPLTPEQLTNQHHNPLNQLNAVENQLRTSGVYSIIKLGPDIEQKRVLIEQQLQAANKSASELDALTSQVRSLLDPATAGALSNAFDVRRKSVSKQKWFWFIMLLISGGVSIWLSIDITNFITTIFKNAEETKTNIGFVWFLRFLLLVPAYFFIGFSVSQFLRERRYEESYAHKLSIAQTLPSYSELIANSDVKDEITSSATRIVFAPPYSIKKSSQPKKGIISSELKEIADVFNSIKGD